MIYVLLGLLVLFPILLILLLARPLYVVLWKGEKFEVTRSWVLSLVGGIVLVVFFSTTVGEDIFQTFQDRAAATGSLGQALESTAESGGWN